LKKSIASALMGTCGTTFNSLHWPWTKQCTALQTDERTTLWCSEPIILHAVRSAKTKPTFTCSFYSLLRYSFWFYKQSTLNIFSELCTAHDAVNLFISNTLLSYTDKYAVVIRSEGSKRRYRRTWSSRSCRKYRTYWENWSNWVAWCTRWHRTVWKYNAWSARSTWNKRIAWPYWSNRLAVSFFKVMYNRKPSDLGSRVEKNWVAQIGSRMVLCFKSACKIMSQCDLLNFKQLGIFPAY